MAKLQIKSENITPFGRIFSIIEQFDVLLSNVIDSILGLQSRTYSQGKPYLLVIQRQKRTDNIQEIWEYGVLLRISVVSCIIHYWFMYISNLYFIF